MTEDAFIFPASFAQRRLWFLDQLEPGSSVYSISGAWQMQGSLRLVALGQAIATIIARHETLRTTFTIVDGEPMQLIAERSRPNLTLIDLSGWTAVSSQPVTLRLIEEETQRPFDLANGPLLRVGLIRTDERVHILILTMHHIISDARSMEIFFRELGILYDAFCANRPSPLPTLPIQYADYANWQLQWLEGSALERQLSYWKRQLAGAPTILALPTDYPRTIRPSFRGAIQRFALASERSDALKALSRSERATLFMTVLAGFAIVLGRYSDQTDLAVGAPVSNRSQVEIEDLIGFFVNTLVLRANLSGDPTFRQLLARVREVCLSAYAHQDLPFEKLVEELKPSRDLSRNPLVQVLFDLQPTTPAGRPQLSGLTFRALPIKITAAAFDLALGMRDAKEGLIGWVEYNTALFEATTIDRLIRHIQTLLGRLPADPGRRIWDLPILTDYERRQLLVEWNDTQIDYPPHNGIHEPFEIQAEQTPDAVAALIQDRHLTYRELDRRANQLAHRLRALGVASEVRVGICMERSLGMLIGLLGILKAGGAYVPLDPAYPSERIAFMIEDSLAQVLVTAKESNEIRRQGDKEIDRLLIEDSQAQVLVTAKESNEIRRQGDKEIDRLLVSPSPALLVSRTVVNMSADWPQIGQLPADPPVRRAAPGSLAYVIYTSGSTGRPKGVAVPHRALVNHCIAIAGYYDLRPGDCILQFASISFDIAVEELFPTWAAGATVVLSSDAMLSTATAFSEAIARHRISVLNLPAAYWQMLVHELSASRTRLPEAVRLMVVGSERIALASLAAWRQHEPRIRWLNAYGPTEATVTATIYEPPSPSERHDQRIDEAPIGRPIGNVQTYILDQWLQPAPIGVPGELYIGGAGLARGYLGRPELTAERFVPNPFVSVGSMQYAVGSMSATADCRLPTADCRLYKTGDLARYRHDGLIEFLGRSDLQIKIRGYRIELGEIESAISRHKAVHEAAVVLREDAQGDPRLVAYLVQGTGDRGQGTGVPGSLNGDEPRRPEGTRSDESDPSFVVRPSSLVAELRSFLAQQLPAYMIPAAFVRLDALPLTPNGKVDRRVLATLDVARPDRAEQFAAPRTTIEELLAQIWAETLKLERVGVHDNFFDLGGHSLLAPQIIARVNDVLRVKLPLHQLFSEPTVAGLAKVIANSDSEGSATALEGVNVADLSDEAILDPTIRSQGLPIARPREPSAIFLTGATGFLGAFLLAELLEQTRADIHCLIRAPNIEAGKLKIRKILASYALWNEDRGSRIIPVIGDLAQPLLGLSPDDFRAMAQKIDIIYHSGALVNAFYQYHKLKDTNVRGTEEILRLASLEKVKPVHYVSTIDVFSPVSDSEIKIVREQDSLDHGEMLYGGYAQSKWVAEKLVTIARSRGIPVTIYRPGMIAGHSQTGVWNNGDFMSRVIKGCIQLGSAPELDTISDMTPVDYVSSVLVYLSMRNESADVFHLINPHTVCMNDLFNWLRSFGYQLRQVTYEAWREELMRNVHSSSENALYPLLAHFPKKRRQLDSSDRVFLAKELQIDAHNMHNALIGASIPCPPVDRDLFRVYVSHFINSGFLPAPALIEQ